MIILENLIDMIIIYNKINKELKIIKMNIKKRLNIGKNQQIMNKKFIKN